MKAEFIKLADIIEDKDQPRKFFNELRLKDLANSIKKYGIKSPLAVEDYGNGKFLLRDGARRYRAAKIAGLKEVPAIIDKATSSTERRIIQFHLQEQHESWSGVEKANAVVQLAEELKISISDMAELLDLPRQTIQGYTAFGSMSEKEKMEKINLPLDWVISIYTLKSKTKKLYENTFKEGFVRSDERGIERNIIKQIEAGTLTRRADIAKLFDVFTANPKLIREYVENGFDLAEHYHKEGQTALHPCASRSIKLSSSPQACGDLLNPKTLS